MSLDGLMTFLSIEDKIRRELAPFLRLNFLEVVFDAFFEEIKETLRLAGLTRDVVYYQDITIGRYLKQIAWLRHKRENLEAKYGVPSTFDEDELEIIKMFESDELSIDSYSDM